MRHATWLRLEASPLWHGIYRSYRRLPGWLRTPMRYLLTPRWQIAAWLVRAATRDRVVQGPFCGMRMVLSPLSARHTLGYLLGTQELELRDVLDRVIKRNYGTILNIGAADGYYAIGLALRSAESRIEAFEMLPELHPLITLSAEANGVAARVRISGKCAPYDLQERLCAASPSQLVLMDVEGMEVELLDPVAVPALQHADILVETHDPFVPGCTETLIERFRQTHDIESYTSRPRILSDFPRNFLPPLPSWFPRLAVDLMDERRPGTQCWLFLTAKTATERYTSK